jgi:NAD(P)-dependent dehydrogenase (short-subunit alcohol dehydrogenase family)
MDFGLRDHIAVVVGAAEGIGRAIAREFAAEGAHVAVTDVKPQVNKVADEIERQFGVRCLSIVADVTQFGAMAKAAAQVQERFGRCDHVVCAAGVGSGKFGFPFWNVSPDDWPRVIEVNLLGAVHVAQAFAPALIETAGTLLFLASVAGQIGSQTDPPYSAAKAGVINFAQCAAKDLAAHNVRVNTICPGMVKTTLNQAVWQAWHDQQPAEARLSYEDWTAAKIKNVVPLGRWQSPEDIAAMAVFLASARAENVTGQTINVDGGFVMHW